MTRVLVDFAVARFPSIATAPRRGPDGFVFHREIIIQITVIIETKSLNYF